MQIHDNPTETFYQFLWLRSLALRRATRPYLNQRLNIDRKYHLNNLPEPKQVSCTFISHSQNFGYFIHYFIGIVLSFQIHFFANKQFNLNIYCSLVFHFIQHWHFGPAAQGEYYIENRFIWRLGVEGLQLKTTCYRLHWTSRNLAILFFIGWLIIYGQLS